MSSLSGHYKIFTTNTVAGTLAVHIPDLATNRPIGQIYFHSDMTGDDITKVANDLMKLMEKDPST